MLPLQLLLILAFAMSAGAMALSKDRDRKTWRYMLSCIPFLTLLVVSVAWTMDGAMGAWG